MAVRVLQVIASAERRGAETFALGLGTELGKRGHDVHTAAVEPGSNPELDVEILGDRWRNVTTLRRLRQMMKSADVVVAHGSSALPATAAAGIGLGVPVIYRQISDPEQWTTSLARRLRVRVYLSRMSHVVALTERTGSVVKSRFGVPDHRVTVIPNGVDAARFTPPTSDQRADARREFALDPDELVVAWVGSLSQEKQPELAVEVVEHAGQGILLIAGSGPLAEAVELRSGEHVRLLGSVQDPVSLYRAADALLCTSRTECLPAALIEAGLSGLPVVAPAVGDIAEIVVSEETGLLAQTSDAAALGTALDRLLKSAELRLVFGTAARRHVELGFSLAAVAAAWSDLLEVVAGD